MQIRTAHASTAEKGRVRHPLQGFGFSLGDQKCVTLQNRNEKTQHPREKSERPNIRGHLTNIQNLATKNSLLQRKILFARIYYLYTLTGKFIFRTLPYLTLRFFVDFS